MGKHESLSSENITFDLSSERATMLTALYPQGTAAKGYTFGADGQSGLAGRLDKAERDIEKQYFKNNPEAFKQWKEQFAPTKQKMINDAYQYEVAQTIHGAKEDNDLQLEAQFSAIREGYDMTNMAAFFSAGAAMEEITDDYNTQSANLKMQEAEIPADASTDDGKALSENRAAIRSSLAQKMTTELKAAQDLYDGKIEIAREYTSKFLAAKHREQYEHAKNVLGRSHEASVAFANVQINKNVKKLLQDMVATNPECAKRLLASLDDAHATRIKVVDDKGEVVKDKDGKPTYVANAFNPLGRWCLTHGEVKELMMSAEQQLHFYQMIEKMKNAQKEELLKLENAKICIDADKLALKMPLDMEKIQALQARVDKLLDNGYEGAASTSKYLRNLIEECDYRYTKYKSDAAKLQSEQDFEREFRAYRSMSADASIMAFYAEEGHGDVKIGGEDVVLTDAIDAKNRQILLISNGLDRGVINGERWEKRLKALHEQRADDDYSEAIGALRSAGVTIDREATAKLLGAGSDNQKKTSEALGGMTSYSEEYGRDRSGRLTINNAKNLMFKWKIPTDKGKDVYASISGEQLNIVLDTLARWQARHPNPTEGEARQFIEGVLNDAAKREWRTHWFSENGYEFTGFQDVSRIADAHLRDYFDSRGSGGRRYTAGQILARDMRLLEQAMDIAKVVRQEAQNDIIRMLEKKRTKK